MPTTPPAGASTGCAPCGSRSSGPGSSRGRRASSTPTRSTATGGSSTPIRAAGLEVWASSCTRASPAGSARTSGASSTSAWRGGCGRRTSTASPRPSATSSTAGSPFHEPVRLRARRLAPRPHAAGSDRRRRHPSAGCACSRRPTPRRARLLARPGRRAGRLVAVAAARRSPIDSTPECRLAAAAGRGAGVVVVARATTTTTSSACRARTPWASAADGVVPPVAPRRAGGSDGLGGVAERRRRDAAPRRRGATRPAACCSRPAPGTTTTSDATRRPCSGIEAAIAEAVADGVPVRHVQWWSAIDGYEGWAGFAARSGLFDRDRRTGDDRHRLSRAAA